MAKHQQHKVFSDGWTSWILPRMEGYRVSCCDCGLVHQFEFEVYRVKEQDGAELLMHGVPEEAGKFQILLRAKRHNRATAQVRRYLPKAKPTAPKKKRKRRARGDKR